MFIPLGEPFPVDTYTLSVSRSLQTELWKSELSVAKTSVFPTLFSLSEATAEALPLNTGPMSERVCARRISHLDRNEGKLVSRFKNLTDILYPAEITVFQPQFDSLHENVISIFVVSMPGF